MKIRRHPRPKYVNTGQIFSCGMFGACSDVVLSPCGVLPHDRSASSIGSTATAAQSSSSSGGDDKENRASAAAVSVAAPEILDRQERQRRFQRVPSSTQWELALKLHNRSVRRRPGPIDRLESPKIHCQERPQSLEALVEETIRSKCCSLAAARSLLSLAEKGSSRDIEEMVAMGLHSELVEFLVGDEGNDIDKSAEVLDIVFSLLVLLASSSDLVLRSIARAPGIGSVIERLLRTGPSSSKAAAATTVVMILGFSEIPSLDSSGVLEAVVGALGDREEQVVKSAVKALLALCLRKENRVAAVNTGAVPTLLEMLPDAKGVTLERILASLELLSTTAEGRAAIRRHALAIPLLLSMILRVSDRGTEYAAGVLCSVICTGLGFDSNNEEEAALAMETAFQARASTHLLLLLQSHCTQRARRKAVKLLKALHGYGEKMVSGGGGAAAECDTAAAAAQVVQG